jgi:membrane protease YdiL (CAAX protease family)
MTVTNIPSPEDNPFSRIKVRQIFGWYLLLGIGIYFQIGMIGYTRGIPFDGKTPLDPFVDKIAETYLMILLLALVWRQCRLAGIEIKYLVGKVPDRYQWWPLVGLAIASVVFGVGVFRIFYYPLSFIVPSFVEKILMDNINNSFLITASKTFAPAMYYLILAIYRCAIAPIFYAFLITAIMLHRWAAKWGNIPAIIALCLFFPVSSLSPHFIYIISGILIYVILYAKTRSLLVVIIYMALESIIGTSWYLSYTIFFDEPTGSTLDVFRSQVQLGVLFFVLSAPWVIGFIYKNWSVLKGPLPYFANASEAEKIKAGSET